MCSEDNDDGNVTEEGNICMDEVGEGRQVDE